MRFYFIGDMGSGDKHQQSVSDAMNQHIRNYKKQTFVCGLGDNIYDKGCQSIDDSKFQTHFEIPYSNISDNIPFYMCLGNHDYGNSETHLNDVQHQIDYSNHSKKWKLPSNYYKFRKKKPNVIVDFFIIDTNIDLHKKEDIQKQLDTLVKWIKSSDADWKIVNGHHTWRSVAGHGNAEPILETFLSDLFKKAPFDVYMCGHDHTKQFIQTKINNKDITMIVCGAGGKPYNYKNFFENTPDLLFTSHNLGYGLCDVKKENLTFEFKDPHNQTEFKCKIHKI
jgi:tartrate-resistant acid phosphatase type 5